MTDLNSSLPESPRAEFTDCIKCGGTGRFVSYRGRDCGPCFTCNGRGYRRAGLSAAPARRPAASDDRDANWQAFAAAHPAEAEWLLAKLLDRTIPDYFVRVLQGLKGGAERFGSLTDNQMGVILRGMDRDAARTAARAENRAMEGQPAAPVGQDIGDVSRLVAAFQAAAAAGLRKPMMRFPGVTVALAGPESRNPGALYVKVGPLYVGMIKDGAFQPGRNFRHLPNRQEVLDTLTDAAMNPQEAAQRYGRETGNCSCCGRLLTDPVSVAQGIGPICAGRMGF